MKSIAILMSTYNGAKYIRKQLDSILSQSYDDFELFIRDDGSTDDTIEILKEYEKNPIIHVKYEENIGAIRSYEKLIVKAPKGYAYYAFSDQDDIWYEDKLKVAVETIENEKKDTPLLYTCNQNCVDENGRFLFKRLPDDENMIQPNIMNSMFDSYYSGCTMVLNASLLQAVQRTYLYAGKSLRVYHDAWICAVTQATGKILYDPEAHIDFRRHGGNETTSTYGHNIVFRDVLKTIKRMVGTLHKYSYYKGRLSFRARMLLELFEDALCDKDKHNLEILGMYSQSPARWVKLIIFNPLREYYQKPEFFTWLRFVICIY